MPTRRITRSPVKVTGTVPDGQQFESTLEEDFFTLLRFNPLVERFEVQSIAVEWLDDEKKLRRYTPDALVYYRRDVTESADWLPTLYEVKPDFTEQSESPRRRGPPRTENEAENKLKWAAAERLAARKGWRFHVARESEIRTPYLKNARFLLRHLERTAPSPDEDSLLAWMTNRGSATLAEWAAFRGTDLATRAEVLPACYRLIALRQVSVDLSQILTITSILSVNDNA